MGAHPPTSAGRRRAPFIVAAPEPPAKRKPDTGPGEATGARRGPS